MPLAGLQPGPLLTSYSSAWQSAIHDERFVTASIGRELAQHLHPSPAKPLHAIAEPSCLMLPVSTAWRDVYVSTYMHCQVRLE